MRNLASITVGVAAAFLTACQSKPPVPVAPPVPLSDSATAAISWINAHASPFAIADSVASSEERSKVAALVGDARVIGFSELTEGTAQFTNIIRRTLFG